MKFREYRKLRSEVKAVVDYDFAKVRDYLVMSVDEVSKQENGPFVGQVVLERENADVLNLCVAIWTHNADGSYSKFEGSQEFYSFKNIPPFIDAELSLSRRYEIVFRPNELGTICSERNIKVQTDIKDLPEYVKRSARNCGYTKGSLTAEISDAGLYYRVKIYTEGSTMPIASFLTVSTKGIGFEKQELLNSTHYLILVL